MQVSDTQGHRTTDDNPGARQDVDVNCVPTLHSIVDAEHLYRVSESFSDSPNLPYHNLLHCISTAARCYAAALHHEMDPVNLTLAGLYHDAGHLGARHDHCNIKRAVTAWGAGGDVERLIRATCTPHEKTGRLDEQLIRDADLLETGLSQRMLSCLGEELGYPVRREWVLERLETDWGRSQMSLP